MASKFKIAIVGSRNLVSLEPVRQKVIELERMYPKSWKLVTGGAYGVDKCAESNARLLGVEVEIIRPIDPKNKLDYLFRNVEIITKAEEIFVFWDGLSRGTKFVIDYAKAREKNITVYNEQEKKK